MASFINKRQQARNERSLQELIRSVPGNDRCADCAVRNPGWASWNLGIFLCMRCAALHRKMGTHISKVKSLSMDTWSSDQVESMKRTGNAASNKVYNPRNVKPTIPVDSDEADSAMERFIREKYQTRTVANGAPQVPTRHATGSTTSSEDRPPPPPPKTGIRFMPNLRSTSSQYPSTGSSETGDPGLRSVGSKTSSNNLRSARSNMDLKLQQLQEMGFMDSARNASVLKGVDGNVQRAVEALVRLGEGTSVNGVTVAKSQNEANSVPAQTSSPPPAQQPQQAAPMSNYSSSNTGHVSQPQPATVPAFYTGSTTMSPPKSTNPFDPPVAPPNGGITSQSLQQSFGNLQVSTQPLFPHNTGNWQPQAATQNNPFLTSFGPSTQSPSQYAPNNLTQVQYQPPQIQQQPQVQANPFLRTSRSQNFASTNPFGQPARAQTFDAAFTQGQTTMQTTSQSPFDNATYQPQYQPHIQQPQTYQSPIQSPQPTGAWNQQPFGAATYPPPDQQLQQVPQQSMQTPQFYQHQQQQQQPQVQAFQQQQPAMTMPQQQTGRFDKNSILALYSQPQLAPTRTMAQPSIPEESEVSHQSAQQPHQGLPRSVTMPVISAGMPNNAQPTAGAMNPFSNLVVPGNNNRPTSRGHLSKESADITGHMSGRHSPDAFSGLSARAGR